jgi:hypothetical protein
MAQTPAGTGQLVARAQHEAVACRVTGIFWLCRTGGAVCAGHPELRTVARYYSGRCRHDAHGDHPFTIGLPIGLPLKQLVLIRQNWFHWQIIRRDDWPGLLRGADHSGMWYFLRKGGALTGSPGR